jgi:hypothetical protein
VRSALFAGVVLVPTQVLQVEYAHKALKFKLINQIKSQASLSLYFITAFKLRLKSGHVFKVVTFDKDHPDKFKLLDRQLKDGRVATGHASLIPGKKRSGIEGGLTVICRKAKKSILHR